MTSSGQHASASTIATHTSDRRGRPIKSNLANRLLCRFYLSRRLLSGDDSCSFATSMGLRRRAGLLSLHAEEKLEPRSARGQAAAAPHPPIRSRQAVGFRWRERPVVGDTRPASPRASR